MKNRIAGILLIMILVFANSKGLLYAKETPDELRNLYARSAVLMDADSGRILFGKNEMDILPMASTTKIMTCILTLEYMNENQTGIVSDYAASQPKVHLGMKTGEKYYLEDLLYSLMLESHNDSAVVIAEAIGGTVEGFAEMMNLKAKELGCTDTYFITPNGLDAKDETGVHTTTASDLALIMSYCVQKSPEKETFLKITQTESYRFTDVDEKRTFSCNNHNLFLGMMKEAISGKTGYTNDAGYCYVGAVREGERTFVVALLACGWPNNKGYKWQDTRKLMDYGLEKYEYENITIDTDMGSLLVENGVDSENFLRKSTYVNTEISDSKQGIRLLLSEKDRIETKIVMKDKLKAPIESGKAVGNIYYLLNGKIVAEREIVTVNAVEEIRVHRFLTGILELYCMNNNTQSVK